MREPVQDWSDAYFAHPQDIHGRTVRVEVDAPLYEIAHLWRHGASALEFRGSVAAAHARTLWEEIGPWGADGAASPGIATADGRPVLVNACTEAGFRRAAAAGAAGVGLVRGEFLFALAVATLFEEKFDDGSTVLESLSSEGDFATLTRLLHTPELCTLLGRPIAAALDAAGSAFPAGAPVFVRLFDFGDAYTSQGGPRGTALLLEKLPEALDFLARILWEVQSRHTVRFVLAPPMVSSYAELTSVLSRLARIGLSPASGDSAATGQPGFGWEVETPAAALCTGLWADHLLREHRLTPAVCGIGTNDLTQFTLARGRRTTPSAPGRPEAHPAVLALLARLAADCQDRGITAVLSGAAAEDSGYRNFGDSLGLLASCTPYALFEDAGAESAAILEQAVSVDALPGVGGLPEVIVWRRVTAHTCTGDRHG
ncbi:putative PEP-binding protein [Streptomyces sp. NBC_01244]|uniref:putative PEP-binding protein n=1 Tax=Streptomyces sp. NBC_01244 TaxID=2903797 RepID=UPI002E0DEDCE|nr:hypothetical protein OG247_41065 [Streptomyces sp. NBC_01244]